MSPPTAPPHGMFDELETGTASFGADGRLLWSNKAFRTLLGRSDDFFEPGASLRTIFGSADADQAGGGPPPKSRSVGLTEGRATDVVAGDGRRLRVRSSASAKGELLVEVTEAATPAVDEGGGSEADRLETQLTAALATISDGILLVDADDRVQMWNERYLEIFSQAAGGIDLTGLVVKNRPFFEMIRHGYELGMFKPHPDGVDAWMAGRRETWRLDRSRREVELANGDWLIISERSLPGGGHLSVYTDITELKTREREAAAARERFEAAIESMTSGFALWDAEDRLSICNAPYRTFFEGVAELLEPGVAFETILEESVARGMTQAAADEQESYKARVRARRAEAAGEPREQLIGARWLQIRDHRTREGGLVSIYTDVSELKARQSEVEAAHVRFTEAIEAVSTGFVLWDADDRMVLCNSRYRRYFEKLGGMVKPGARFEDLIRAAVERGAFPAAADMDPDDFTRQVVERRRAASGETREQHLENDLWLLITDHRTSSGGIVSIYTDVSELKRAQRALDAALQEIDAVLENIAYGVVFMGPDLRTRITNRAFRDMWGLPQDFLDARPHMRDLVSYNRFSNLYDVADENFDAWIEERVAVIEAGSFPARTLPLRDGRVIQIEGIALPDGGRMLAYYDVSDLKHAEQAARDGEVRLRGILENSPIGVAVIDEGTDRILFHNPRFAAMLGSNGDDFVGEAPDRFWTDLDARAEALERFRETGRVVDREVRYRRADGSHIWARSTYEAARWDDRAARLIWIYDVTEEKANREALVEARDAAEAALADLRHAQEKLIHSEKMASLGQLTAGIAHEIKNPLNFVNNFAKLSAEMMAELADVLKGPIARLEADDREDADDLMETIAGNLRKIDEHGRRADSIVKNMLLHSREGTRERQSVDLNAIALEAMNLAYHGARAANPSFNVDLGRDMADDLGEIEGQPQELQRVFLNLCSNGMYAAARRSGGDGASPRLALSSRRENGMLIVEVADNGDGVPKEIRGRIFQPFFTTKPTGEGTGLGLSMSYDIVRQHGGEMSLETGAGRGATFRVAIPAAGGAAGGAEG